jgi:ATP-dependent Clp protease protease subunit
MMNLIKLLHPKYLIVILSSICLNTTILIINSNQAFSQIKPLYKYDIPLPSNTPIISPVYQDSSRDINQKLLKQRIIVISEPINDDLAKRVISQLLYLDSQATGKDIYLYINSPGGLVSSGMAIYDTMQSLRSDIVTVSTGLSASMASILLAGGTKGKRFSLPHSRIMIHQALAGGSTQSADIEIQAKELLFWKQKLNQLLAKLTGQPLKRVEADTERDFFMSAQEAKAYGIIDQVINKRPASTK